MMATKIFVGALLDRKLKEIGIKGKYYYTDRDKDGNAAMLSDVQFEDPKDRFIYELHGGVKLWDEVFDALLKIQQVNKPIPPEFLARLRNEHE